ncbi:hypothetical protein [Acinetobacter sp.]|uniref:hypothetical protein n=1 Tax=Acinetobacter sp. TaxID=472 RepID=UPI003890560F
MKHFDKNIAGSIILKQAMQKAKVFNLIFTSSVGMTGRGHPSSLNKNLLTNNYEYSELIVEHAAG